MAKEKEISLAEMAARMDGEAENRPDVPAFLSDAMEDGAPVEKPTLERLTILVKQMRDLSDEIAAAELALSELQRKHAKLEGETIPGIMAELDIAEMKMADGSSLTIKEDFRCSLSEDRKPAAWAWLEDKHYDGIIKTKVVSEFGRGEMEDAKKAIAALEEQGFGAVLDRAVHPMTLKAFVKERLQAGEAIPMDVFGVFPVTKAVVKLPKRR